MFLPFTHALLNMFDNVNEYETFTYRFEVDFAVQTKTKHKGHHYIKATIET